MPSKSSLNPLILATKIAQQEYVTPGEMMWLLEEARKLFRRGAEPAATASSNPHCGRHPWAVLRHDEDAGQIWRSLHAQRHWCVPEGVACLRLRCIM